MHAEARAWVEAHAPSSPVAVVEVGGRNINGGVRDLFDAVTYLSVDLEGGPGVDVVADFATFTPEGRVDVVVCCEVFEHTESWRALCAHAAEVLEPDGQFLVTAAGPGREPHSAHDGGPLRGGEFYENVTPGDLSDVLDGLFESVKVDQSGPDVRALACYPRR